MRKSKKIQKLNKKSRLRLPKKCGTLFARLFLLLVIRIYQRIYRVEILQRSIKIVRILTLMFKDPRLKLQRKTILLIVRFFCLNLSLFIKDLI
jgi:hypothetical protein